MDKIDDEQIRRAADLLRRQRYDDVAQYLENAWDTRHFDK
jgi:hypothetical protein